MKTASTSYISAFHYGTGLPSVISAARLLRLRTAVASQNDQPRKSISPFSPEARVPLPCEMDDKYVKLHNHIAFGNQSTKLVLVSKVICFSFGTSVWKRNERERYRVRCVNDGYERLREHLPLTENDRRISKVDTLRLAIRYIRHLEELLNNEEHFSCCDCFASFRTENEEQLELRRQKRKRNSKA
uniref:BHLH domain-containing protein n=1 Tax=Syphacia muris TaxID=451379 RepID=A0A0N5A9Y6_9BILA